MFVVCFTDYDGTPVYLDNKGVGHQDHTKAEVFIFKQAAEQFIQGQFKNREYYIKNYWLDLAGEK